jgi:hypothetical protein
MAKGRFSLVVSGKRRSGYGFVDVVHCWVEARGCRVQRCGPIHFAACPSFVSPAGSAHVRRIEAGDQIRALDTLADPDYAAAWEVAIADGDARSAEQWARLAFEDAPRALRAFIVAGWTFGLRLRLGPRPSPDHVLGWTIASAATDRIILSVQSGLLGTAHLVLQIEGSRIVLASFVRYEKRGARPIWSAVQPLHHQILPYLLGRAASRSLSSQAARTAARASPSVRR